MKIDFRFGSPIELVRYPVKFNENLSKPNMFRHGYSGMERKLMQTNHRMEQVQSPIIPIVGEWVKECPGTISVGQGVVGYTPPPNSKEWIMRFWDHPSNHKYKLVHGIPELKEKIELKLQEENGIHLNETNNESYSLCVTAGGNMAFMNAILAITDSGDEIILLAPYYFNHEMAVQIADAIPVSVYTDENYQPDIEQLEKSITKKTKAIVTVSPNNPSGAVYPEDTLRTINTMCQNRGVYHIHDEAYEYFTYNDACHFSPGSIHGASRHTISLYSLSKAYGFASWRIGYMVYPNHLDMPVRKVQDTILICPSVISQYAAAGALEAGREYCQEQQREIVEVREILIDSLQQLTDVCDVKITQGAFYFLLKIPGKMDEMRLTEQLIRDHGVAVIPGQCFGMKDACYLRISYGSLSKERAKEGMNRLVDGLHSLVGEMA